MIGDHQLRGAGAADRVLDETAAVMGAGAMDALAAPVGERRDESGPVQFAKPAGQVAAMDVAVLGDGGPTGDEAEGDELVLQKAGGRRC